MSSCRYYKGNNVYPSKANSIAICTVFVQYKMLITKLSVTIYISALYKSNFFLSTTQHNRCTNVKTCYTTANTKM